MMIGCCKTSNLILTFVFGFLRDNNSAEISIYPYVPREVPISEQSATTSNENSNCDISLPPRTCIHRYGSPPSTRSVSFVRDLKTSEGLASAGHDAGCRAKAYKRQSMSVGDSIDERVETNFDYLSVHSLAVEPGLECCTGGSDIIAMVAASENAPICCAQSRLAAARNSVDALPNTSILSQRSAASGLVDVEGCRPRRYGAHTVLRVNSSTSSESTSIEIISCYNETPSLLPLYGHDEVAIEDTYNLLDGHQNEADANSSTCSDASSTASTSAPLFPCQESQQPI